MNRQRIVLIVGGAFLGLIILALVALGLTPKNQANQPSYTDLISGTTLTAFTETYYEGEHTHEHDVPSTEVSIVGLDDFYATIDQSQGRVILDSLTAFIRARTGPGIARASVIDAKVNQQSVNPSTYTFDLVVLNPYSKYSVTVVIPESPTAAATVTYQGVSQ